MMPGNLIAFIIGFCTPMRARVADLGVLRDGFEAVFGDEG